MADYLEETKNLILQRSNIQEGGQPLYDYMKRLILQLQETYEELASAHNQQEKKIRELENRIETLEGYH